MHTASSMPKKTVWAAGLIILALAALGTYQGVHRASTDADSTDTGLPTLTAPAANAKAAAPFSEPTASVLTEAQVRDIARQELRASQRRPDTSASEPSETPASGAASANATAAASRPATVPAAGPTVPAAPAAPAVRPTTPDQPGPASLF